MSTTRKPDSSRLNLFYIIHVLQKYSNVEYPMSVADIQARINQEFAHVSVSDSVISIDTIKRILEELIEKVFPQTMNLAEYEEAYGFYIGCLMKKGNEFVFYHTTEGAIAPKKFYYYEGALKEAEILTLKDAIETYSYFSEEDITEIVRKLVRVRPCSFPKKKYFDVSREERDEDSLLLMNIDLLNDIIQKHNGANITYCAYDIDKKLVPRPGYPKYVEPLHLLWSNGYYYLLAYNEKYQNIVSYRVDRITDIEEVKVENSHRVEEFNPVQYRHEHPVMYGGKKEKMILLCRDTGKNYIMNTIMDVFGKNAKVKRADDVLIEKHLSHTAEYYKMQGITWLQVAIETTTGGVELWATQYCNDCRIVEPAESAERVKQRLVNGLEYYN